MNLLLEQISEQELKFYLNELYNYCLDKLDKIDRPPKIFFDEDQANADDIFGKTGYYDPDKEEIHLFITDRHPKDILRSLAHEMVHHEQNCRGDTKKLNISLTANDPAYASHDMGLREMEREAFERGNMIFRDWCDMKKLERTNIMENKKLKVRVMKEKKMTGPQIKKAHEIGKAVKKAGSAKEPFAVGMAAVQKNEQEEMDEMSYEKAKEAGLENPKKADLKTSGKKGDGDISDYELKRGMAIQKNMKKEAAGEPEELDFEKMPASHQKAGMSAFGHDEEEMGGEPEAGEEEVEISPLDSAQSLARQIKMALTTGDTSKARELTKELIMFLQKNPSVKMQTKAGSDVDLSKLKTEAGAGFGEGPEGKENLSEKKMKCEACGGMYGEGKKHKCSEGKKAMNESKEAVIKETNPYPQLFDKKERFMKDRFETHEETIYQELMKRFIQK